MKSKAIPCTVLVGILALACCCFLASLFLPCIYTRPDDPSPFIGMTLLLFGPFGIFCGVVAWYANLFLPPLFLLFLLRKFRLVVLCGVASLVLALSTLAMREMMVSEQPRYELVTGYGPGFYLWLASFATPVIAALFFLNLTDRVRGEEQVPAKPQAACRPSENTSPESPLAGEVEICRGNARQD